MSLISDLNWLKQYLDFNIEKRTNANNQCEKDFFKLRNNSVFGKAMDNFRKRVDFAVQIPWLKRLRCCELGNMKVLVLFSVLFVTIFILLQHVSSISTLDKATYDLFVQLIKGEFTVPVESRTVQQKSAVVRFWRNREKLTLRGGILCYDGKSVVKEEGVSEVVKKMYKSSKGPGVRKIYHKLKNS